MNVLILLFLASLVDLNEIQPPKPKRDTYSFTKFGITLEDDYHYFEDKDSEEYVSEYIKKENKYRGEVLDRRLVDLIHEELRTLKPSNGIANETVGEVGGWQYFSYQPRDSYSIWLRRKKEDEPGELVLDENDLHDPEDEYFFVSGVSPSKDGKYVAYTLDKKGVESYQLLIRDITSQKEMGSVKDVHGGLFWSKNSEYILYLKQSLTVQSLSVYMHKIGASQEDDEEVFSTEDNSFQLSLRETSDGEYFVISVDSPYGNEVHYFEADFSSKPEVTKMFDFSKDVRHKVDHGGSWWYVMTQEDAINFKVVRTDLANNSTVLQEGSDDFLVDSVFSLGEDKAVVLNYVFETGMYEVVLFEGEEGVKVPVRECDLNQTSVWELLFSPESKLVFGNPYFGKDYFDLKMSSLVQPGVAYRYDYEHRALTKLWRNRVEGFDPKNYQIEYQLINSTVDDEKIPVVLAYRLYHYRKFRPTYLDVFSTYGQILKPGFQQRLMPIIDRGAVYVITNARGSAALGMQWYYDGRGEKKHLTTMDLLSTVHYLTKVRNVTNRNNLAIHGVGEGAIPVANLVAAHGNLFDLSIMRVPRLDMLNSLLQKAPLEGILHEEFGNPNATKDEFVYFRDNYAYYNLNKTTYPSTYVDAGLHDASMKMGAFKFHASVRNNKKGDSLAILNAHKGGHLGAGESAVNLEVSKMHAFFIKAIIGFTWYDPLQWLWVLLYLIGLFCSLGTFSALFVYSEVLAGRRINREMDEEEKNNSIKATGNINADNYGTE